MSVSTYACIILQVRKECCVAEEEEGEERDFQSFLWGHILSRTLSSSISTPSLCVTRRGMVRGCCERAVLGFFSLRVLVVRCWIVPERAFFLIGVLAASGTSFFSCKGCAGGCVWGVQTPAYRVGGSEGGGASSRPVAKNKLTWTSEGRRMVTGDAKGNVDVWTVAAEVRDSRHASFVFLLHSGSPFSRFLVSSSRLSFSVLSKVFRCLPLVLSSCGL